MKVEVQGSEYDALDLLQSGKIVIMRPHPQNGYNFEVHVSWVVDGGKWHPHGTVGKGKCLKEAFRDAAIQRARYLYGN